MGAGGTSGAVSFPAFIEDLHGHILASTGVDTAGGSTFVDQNFTKPNTDVIELLNTAWGDNPYTGFAFTPPDTPIQEVEDQFDLFYTGVTERLTETKFSDYITKALLAVTSSTTSADPGTVLADLDFDDCDAVSIMGVLQKAANSAEDSLRLALQFLKRLLGTGPVSDLVEAFAARRETTYQNQVSDYAGTMADLNAVNSSAFLFGVALLKSEQQREVSEFDAQISLQLLQQGLSTFQANYAAALQAGVTVARHNSQLEFDAARLNKAAKEQRFIQGFSQILGLITNRVEYERLASALLTQQRALKLDETRKYEGLEIEDLEREVMWDLHVARTGIDILSAPGGMAAAVPKLPHPALQIAGTAFQAVGAAGSIAGGG